MRCAIKFDCDIALHAKEIDNIAIHAVLPTELLSENLPALKVFPKHGFWGSSVVSEFSSSGFERRYVDQVEIMLGHTRVS